VRSIGDAGRVKAWVEGVPIEDEALAQAQRVASLPFVHRHVAVMPDAHVGKGATIGTVIATKGALVPAAVGVDLGCGMVARQTSLRAVDLPDDLATVRRAIERAVPHGRTDRGGPADRGAWGNPPAPVGRAARTLLDDPRFRQLSEAYPSIAHRRAAHQLGTLGTGNHFIEVCLDQAERVWVMLHSGSRGQGARIAGEFIARARGEMERHAIELPDRDLAWLTEGAPHFEAYVRAVEWAQDYARTNRELMLDAVLAALRTVPALPPFTLGSEAVDCHHNYVAREHHFGADVWVTRKGAINAERGRLGLIPGSMGARSFVVRGKGHRAAFNSASHGAGRRGSRTWARSAFTVADHAAATAGIECRKDADVIDETPGAYKDIDAVMAAQAELVEVVHTLRQVVCVKG
jgi:tRNA-splicing ligase RtcB